MGLLNKTLKRVRTGDTQIENKTPFDFYLSNVEWVDLGHPDVLFARYDYPLNYRTSDFEMLSLDDIRDIQQKLSQDIFIMNKQHIKWLKDYCRVIIDHSDKRGNRFIRCQSSLIGDSDAHVMFDLFDNPKDDRTVYVVGLPNDKNMTQVNQISTNRLSFLGTTTQMMLFPDNNNLHIKLTKLK